MAEAELLAKICRYAAEARFAAYELWESNRKLAEVLDASLCVTLALATRPDVQPNLRHRDRKRQNKEAVAPLVDKR